jgi:hypothetical protein
MTDDKQSPGKVTFVVTLDWTEFRRELMALAEEYRRLLEEVEREEQQEDWWRRGEPPPEWTPDAQ